MQIIKNKTCRMCNSKSFLNVINLGKHPLVNRLIGKKELNKKDLIYPYLSVDDNMTKISARIKDSEDIKRGELIKNIQNHIETNTIDAILHIGDFAYDFDTDNGIIGNNFMNDIHI